MSYSLYDAFSDAIHTVVDEQDERKTSVDTLIQSYEDYEDWYDLDVFIEHFCAGKGASVRRDKLISLAAVLLDSALDDYESFMSILQDLFFYRYGEDQVCIIRHNFNEMEMIGKMPVNATLAFVGAKDE